MIEEVATTMAFNNEQINKMTSPQYVQATKKPISTQGLNTSSVQSKNNQVRYSVDTQDAPQITGGELTLQKNKSPVTQSFGA